MIGRKTALLGALAGALALTFSGGSAHAGGAYIAKAYNQTSVNIHWGDSCDNRELVIDIPHSALQATFQGRWDSDRAYVARVTFINRTDFVHGFSRGEFYIEDNGQTPAWRVADMAPHSSQTVELNYTSAGAKTLVFAYPFIGVSGKVGSCNLSYVGVER